MYPNTSILFLFEFNHHRVIIVLRMYFTPLFFLWCERKAPNLTPKFYTYICTFALCEVCHVFALVAHVILPFAWCVRSSKVETRVGLGVEVKDETGVKVKGRSSSFLTSVLTLTLCNILNVGKHKFAAWSDAKRERKRITMLAQTSSCVCVDRSLSLWVWEAHVCSSL